MPKKRPSIEVSRLAVLAAGDEDALAEHAIALLGSGQRLAREAALGALIERPLAAARDALRALYFELDPDGAKRDQGTSMRVAIVRVLTAIGDVRDADIGVRSIDCYEQIFGDDVSWTLRVHGLRMLADMTPDLLPYYAIEHLDDQSPYRTEPASTAFALLAATGNYVPIYQWLLAGDRDPQVVANAFEVLAGAPREIVRRYVGRVIDVAIRKQDEAMYTVLVESIVEREFEEQYGAIARVLDSKLSDELYNYIALLLAGANRRPLLAILEQHLHVGRRPQIIVAALRVRPTPEAEAILRRWDAADAED